MKKFYAIITAALLLCGCAQNENAVTETSASESVTTEIVTEQTASVTTATETKPTEAVSSEIELSETKADCISECFIYDGENPMLKTTAQIFEWFSGNSGNFISRYDYFDFDGDYEEELLFLAPYGKSRSEISLYIIKQNGEYKKSPPLFAVENNYAISAEGYCYENGDTGLTIVVRGGSNAIAYNLTSALDEVTVADAYVIDGAWSCPQNSYRRFNARFKSAEGITSADFIEEIETEFAKTPLERAIEYSESLNRSNVLLCDLTGDNYPELISIGWDGYVWDLGYNVYDLSGRYPVGIASGILDADEKIKLICADDGTRKLISKCTLGCASGYGDIEAEESELYFGADTNSRVIGEAEFYLSCSKDKAYCTELYMNNTEYERTGLFDGQREAYTTIDEAFDKMYSDYLSDYEILLEIGLDENDCVIVDGNTSEFSSYPEIGGLPAPDIQYVEICGEKVRVDSNTVTIRAEKLEADFDFDILNSFENLRTLNLTKGYYSDYDSKIKIVPSEWCSRVKNLRINTDIYELDGSYGCFGSLRSIYVNGRTESLDFITEIQGLEVFTCDYAPDYEYLMPLTELPKLAVIADSGYGSFVAEWESEIPEALREKMSEWVWSMVKVG